MKIQSLKLNYPTLSAFHFYTKKETARSSGAAMPRNHDPGAAWRLHAMPLICHHSSGCLGGSYKKQRDEMWHDNLTSNHPNWCTIWDCDHAIWSQEWWQVLQCSFMFCHYNPTFAIISSKRASAKQVILKPFIIHQLTAFKSGVLYIYALYNSLYNFSIFFQSNIYWNLSRKTIFNNQFGASTIFKLTSNDGEPHYAKKT